MVDLALVPAPDVASDDDALTPETILRSLGEEIASNPFAATRRMNAVRSAGIALQSALGKVDAARALLAGCEAEARRAADRGLTVLTER